MNYYSHNEKGSRKTEQHHYSTTSNGHLESIPLNNSRIHIQVYMEHNKIDHI